MKASRIVAHLLFFLSVLVLSFLFFLQLWVQDASDIVVPNFEGMTATEAREKASELGINIQRAPDEFSIEFNEGRVIRQKPASGGTVVQGRNIHLTFSKGLKDNWTQEWIGKPWQDAVFAIEKMNAKIEMFETCQPSEPENIIALTHDDINSVIRVLLSKKNCGEGWIVKEFGSNQYRDTYKREFEDKNISLQWASGLSERDLVQTNPPAGAVIYPGDTLWVRKATQ